MSQRSTKTIRLGLGGKAQDIHGGLPWMQGTAWEWGMKNEMISNGVSYIHQEHSYTSAYISLIMTACIL